MGRLGKTVRPRSRATPTSRLAALLDDLCNWMNTEECKELAERVA